ncbi:hypothetical protein GCM10009836_22830 [Pseudonocardia ailaonensis]|uniref:Methyltransferase domain-containing protein n=1 Tax=Pseudonocardia ailaonensis TaxID=367279 RepID=A0ABN2MXV8_9PSEU
MSGTETSTVERPGPPPDAAPRDRGARAYEKLLSGRQAYRDQLVTTATRMGLSGGALEVLNVRCTGASLQALIEVTEKVKVLGIDTSQDMLNAARGEQKTWPPDFWLIRSGMVDLDANLAEVARRQREKRQREPITGPFDGALVADHFRMLTPPQRDAELQAILARLKPGAPVAIQEMAVRGSLRLRLLWTLACFLYLIPLGRIQARAKGLTRHLWRSVMEFESADEFKERMRAAGFEDVRKQTMSGWQQHLTYTFLGRAPERAEPDPEEEFDPPSVYGSTDLDEDSDDSFSDGEEQFTHDPTAEAETPVDGLPVVGERPSLRLVPGRSAGSAAPATEEPDWDDGIDDGIEDDWDHEEWDPAGDVSGDVSAEPAPSGPARPGPAPAEPPRTAPADPPASSRPRSWPSRAERERAARDAEDPDEPRGRRRPSPRPRGDR